MSTGTHTIPDDQVRNAFQRWKNLEEEKARLSEDLKELFAEQKAFGHDTKAMRAAFRLKVKMDEASPADAEHEALVDTYLAALSAPSRAYTRDAREERSEIPSGGGADPAIAANAGGTDVESSAPRAGLADPTSNTGEGTALSALPANSGLIVESVPPSPMKRPEFASCFPELSNAAYAHLHDEIQASGICAPIIRSGEVIVDGWDRYNISCELGFNYPVQPYSGNDVLLDVIEWQRASRNFTPAQEKKIATDLAKEIPHRADDIMAAFGLAEALEAAE